MIMNRTDFFKHKQFKEIDLNDDFFDSLKSDYAEFEEWFQRKANDYAYVHEDEKGIQAFLYLKIESEQLHDVTPQLPFKKRIKIGTLKINPRGTRFGERFIKKAIDFAIVNDVSELYLTVFEKHESLVNLISSYGFYKHGFKQSANGKESVYIKKISKEGFTSTNIRHSYPLINTYSNSYLLSIYPQFHSRLFPDSILNTEDPYNIIKDVSYSNSIEKIYISRIEGATNIQATDNIVIYRTREPGKSAEYSAVASSICTVVEVKTRSDFNSVEEVISYCLPYSIFTEEEIRREYNARTPMVIIRMLYNTALTKRIIRRRLINECQIDRDQYWGIIKLTEHQFLNILKLGEVNESIIIN